MSLPSELIEKILKATSPREILTAEEYKKEYHKFSLLIHPDKCSLPNADQAFAKLSMFKDFFEKGANYSDGISNINIKGNTIILDGPESILKTCLGNYKILMSYKDKAAVSFQRYLPVKGEIVDKKLIFTCTESTLAVINDKTLPEEHARWILSRLLEFVGWLDSIGYVHAGLTPDAFCIVPPTHGVVIFTFYNLEKVNTKLKTITGKYINWYEFNTFKDKKAVSAIDLTMAKKCAIFIMGDKSGNGVKLRSKTKAEFIDFLLKFDRNAIECFKDYRGIIKKLYDRKYYPLVL